MQRIEKMIEELDKACGGTLRIDRSLSGWNVYSYGSGIFNNASKYGWIHGKTLREAVEKAYSIMKAETKE